MIFLTWKVLISSLTVLLDMAVLLTTVLLNLKENIIISRSDIWSALGK